MERLHSRAHRPVRLAPFGRLKRLLELRRQRQSLGQLGEDRLRDLGITQAEARTEAGRPVWDVPGHWRR